MEHSIKEQVEEGVVDSLDTRLGFLIHGPLEEMECFMNEELMFTLAQTLKDLESLGTLTHAERRQVQAKISEELVSKSYLFQHDWEEYFNES